MLKRIPVFPNWFPYNPMLFDNRLKVGNYDGVKTRSYEWDYRGPILFYTSGRTDRGIAAAYGYVDAPSHHKVVIGYGELHDVRPLTTEEAWAMVRNFNNLTVEQVNKILELHGLSIEEEDPFDWAYITGLHEHVTPLRIGYFFKNLKRFKGPVPFKWEPGPVKPIFTKLEAGSHLHTELKKLGVR